MIFTLTYIPYSWYMYYNKNVDIKFSAHDAFLEYPSSGTLRVTIIRYAQNNHHQVCSKTNNFKNLLERETEGLNRLANIGYGYLCLLNYTYILLHRPYYFRILCW